MRNKFTPNEIITYDDCAEIILYDKHNQEKARTMINIDDIEKCKKYKWGLSNGYVATRHDKELKKSVTLFLHRYVMNCPKGKEVDHKDRNKLDNRKSNLRICNRSQNQRNMKAIEGVSKYKGVVWIKKEKLWRVRLTCNNKVVYGAKFDCEKAAANAYNYYAKLHHGDFAVLNDVEFMPIEEWENKRRKVINTSGFVGVTLHKKSGKWRSRVSINNKEICIGYFDTPEEAHLAREEFLKQQLHKNNHIVAIVAFSGAGKDSIARKLESDHNYKFVVSTTSRPIRSSESNGREYYFVTDEEFQELIINNKLIEYRNYNTYQNGKSAIWHYGITRESVDLNKGNHVAIVDIKGLKDLKKEFGDKVISIFIDVDEETRRNRAMQRDKNFELKEWNRRYADDVNIFKTIHNEVDHIVENYDFDKCMENIIKILREVNND